MRTKGADFVWFDGKIVKWEEATVPVTTHALHYGTAVFEGIRAYSSKNNLHVAEFMIPPHPQWQKLLATILIQYLQLKRAIGTAMTNQLCWTEMGMLAKRQERISSSSETAKYIPHI